MPTHLPKRRGYARSRFVVCVLAAFAALHDADRDRALALDTLRVGLNGNMTWTGRALGVDVTPITPEFIVSAQSTEIGNTPGNLIALAILDDVTPAVVVESAVDSSPELLAQRLALVNEHVTEAVSGLPGVRSTEASTQRALALVTVRFSADVGLDDALEAVREAVASIPPESLAEAELSVLPVALGPDHAAAGENISHRALGWGGEITAPAIQDIPRAELNEILLELIQPGGTDEAFERKSGGSTLGTFVVLDLGSPIGINRIRFFPRNTVFSNPQFPFQNDFLHQFDLLLHDGQNLVFGSSGKAAPRSADYKILQRIRDNESAVVDIEVSPPELARFVRLKATSAFPYEIDELEVYGQGFLSSGRYVSHVYKLDGPAAWGNISWTERSFDLATTIGGGTGAGSDGAQTADDCVEERSPDFFPEDEIGAEWGDCVVSQKLSPGGSYTRISFCYKTICRNEFDEFITTPGKLSVSEFETPETAEPARVLISTRTGTDPNPVLYQRVNVERPTLPQQSTSLTNQGVHMDRDEYLGLTPDPPGSVWGRGNTEPDVENWSPWSAPYLDGDQPGGTPILSPGPRRYIQFAVDFQNSSVNTSKMLEQVSIEFLFPAIAEDLVAEIFPREVGALETVQFTYAVRAVMDVRGVKGFNALEIDTPTRVLGVDAIQIADDAGTVLSEVQLDVNIVLGDDGFPAAQLEDGSVHELPYSIVSNGGTFTVVTAADDRFIVQFPPVSRPSGGGERLVKVLFRSQVLVYSTLFRGKAVLTTEAGTVQTLSPGNADALGEGDLPTASGITVLSPAVSGHDLIGALVAAPNPFTPNGDAVNDVLAIEYDLLAITAETEIRMRMSDLSGRVVRDLYVGRDVSGHYDQSVIPELIWDGTDGAGNRVPPGIYLLHISVEGDARQSQKVRPIALVY